METKQKQKELDSILAKINREAAKTQKGDAGPIIFRASDRPDLIEAKRMSTGIASVDDALGGGLPRGAITTFWGPYNCGKTWLAMRTAAKITTEGGHVLYVDLEGMGSALHVFEKELGLDLSKVYVLRGRDYGDELVDAIEALLYDKTSKTPLNLLDMVIVDSISNFVPKANTDKVDKDGAEGGTKVGAHAKLMTDFLTRYYGRGVVAGNQVVILISQARANISTTGGPGGPTLQPSGGNAVLHDSKIILKFGKKGIYKKVQASAGSTAVNTLIGHTVLINVEKNSLTGLPGVRAEYAIQYGLGLDDTEGLIQRATDWGYLVPDKRGWSTLICPPLGDILVKNSEIVPLIRTRKEVSQGLRDLFALGKPKDAPTKTGIEYTIEIEEETEEE